MATFFCDKNFLRALQSPSIFLTLFLESDATIVAKSEEPASMPLHGRLFVMLEEIEIHVVEEPISDCVEI